MRHAELRVEHQMRVGRKCVERLMKAVERGSPDCPAPDLVGGHHLHLDLGGVLYLAHVQDLFSRPIVSWSMADHLRSDLVVDELEMTLCRRRPARGSCTVVIRSRQGGADASTRRTHASLMASLPAFIGGRGIATRTAASTTLGAMRNALRSVLRGSFGSRCTGMAHARAGRSGSLRRPELGAPRPVVMTSRV